MGLDVGDTEASNEIRKEAERCCALVLASSDFVFRTSADTSEMRQLNKVGALNSEKITNTGLAEWVHPDDRAEVIATFERAAKAKSLVEMEHRLTHSEGKPRWVSLRAVPLLDEHGAIEGWFGTASDITPRKIAEERRLEAEARQSFLLRLQDRLQLITDPVQIQFEAARAIGEQLGANRVGYAETLEGEDVVVITTAYVEGLPEISGRYRLVEYGPELLTRFRLGYTVAFTDVANDPLLTEEQKAAHMALQSGADVNVPLVRSGELRALLFVHSKSAREWTETEIKLVEEVAARTWDAVERARAEAALARRAAELEAILASMPDALYIGDRTGIKRTNQLGLEQLGFRSFQELQDDIEHLGERIQTRDAKTGKRFSGDEEPFAQALSGQTVVREVAITHLVSGKEVIVRCSARPIWFEGHIIGAVAINTDITAERQAEDALARQALELARSNDDLQQFAHVAAHDLQTPLRAVRSYAQLLQRRYVGQLDATADEFIHTIIDGVDTMRRLTEGLLHLAQAGEGRGQQTNIRVETVVDGVLLSLKPMIEETQAEITCGDLPRICADPLQMLQLFQNLVGNALKYRHPGRTPRVRITAEQRNQSYWFAVSDNGLGIEVKYQERVFAPLHRLHGNEIPGSGIGLAVCKKIVERHGGRIWVESQVDVGSTFHFTLPVT